SGMELASLGIEVDSRQVMTARQWLDHLSGAGSRAEKSMEGVGRGGRAAATGNDAASASARKVTAALRDQENAAAALTATIRRYAGIVAGAFGVSAMKQAADAWGQVNSRLRIAVGVG